MPAELALSEPMLSLATHDALANGGTAPPPPSTGHSYQNKSKDIVRAEHPDWTNETQIAAQAAIEFDAAAKVFYEATIAQMRSIRPKAR